MFLINALYFYKILWEFHSNLANFGKLFNFEFTFKYRSLSGFYEQQTHKNISTISLALFYFILLTRFIII